MAQRQPGAEHRGGGHGADAQAKGRVSRCGQIVGEVVERILDRAAELLQGGAARGAGLQGGVDRVAELAGQVGTEAAQRARSAADRARRRGGRRAAIRVLAAPALVQGQSERVDVGLGAGGLALGLLGGHVGEGADDVAGRGQGGAVGEAGDAEVHQLGAEFPLGGDEDVLRLDVAVDDAARVGVVERLAEVGADLADLAVAERPFAAQPGQGAALDQLGDQQRVAVLLAHLVEGDDARVVESRGRLGLAQAPAGRHSPRDSIALTATVRSRRPSQAS